MSFLQSVLFVIGVCAVFAFARSRIIRASAGGLVSRKRTMKLPSDSRSAFLVCTFSMLGKLAEADGQVSPEEVTKVEQFIDEQLQLDRKTKALALKVFRDAPKAPLELRDYAEKFNATFPDRVQLLDRMVEILVEVSVADGVLGVEEERLIRSVALLLGLTEAGYKRIKQKHVTASQTVH